LIFEQKITPYAHTTRLKIEKYANQEEWQENKLMGSQGTNS